MKNKKILLPIILAAVFVIAGISAASAWLFAGAQKNNELTAGDQSIVISESNFTVEPNDVLDKVNVEEITRKLLRMHSSAPGTSLKWKARINRPEPTSSKCSGRSVTTCM